MDAWQAGFEIPGAVGIGQGVNGMTRIALAHASGACAGAYLIGGHVVSWIKPGDEEMLFVSRCSHFEAGKPIRGGIPVVFPQFGPGALPQHGFARTQEWSVAHTHLHDDGTVEALLQLTDNPDTMALWPHRFWLGLRLRLRAGSLRLTAVVTNTDMRPFSFQFALHTYFAAGDVRQASVHGLQGVTFVDSLRDDAREVEARPAVRFDQETDRVYVAVPDHLHLEDEARGRTLTIEKSGMPDVVVWNPWIAKAARMPDFGDDEWPGMLCIETGAIEAPVELRPGEDWRGETTFRIAG